MAATACFLAAVAALAAALRHREALAPGLVQVALSAVLMGCQVQALRGRAAFAVASGAAFGVLGAAVIVLDIPGWRHEALGGAFLFVAIVMTRHALRLRRARSESRTD